MNNQNFDLLFSPDYLPPDSSQDTQNEEAETCPLCGKARQRRITLPNGMQKTVRAQCACQRQAEAAYRKQQMAMEFEIEMSRMHQQDRISDNSHKAYRFSGCDNQNSEILAVCRRYVDHWQEMADNNMGMLLYGTVGTGKTFLAGCVVNALYEQQVRATVTAFPRLLNLLQDNRDRQGLLDQLNRYELLVIDDLGVERDSAYAMEQIYNIVDSRTKAGKPMIVTTNLTLDELKHPVNQQYARIYDRILESCPITLKMTGDSRRASNAQRKRELAKALLLGN